MLFNRNTKLECIFRLNKRQGPQLTTMLLLLFPASSSVPKMWLLLLLFVAQSGASVIIPKDSFGMPVINLLQTRENSTGDDYCYVLDEDPYLLFATKTAYEYTRGDLYNDMLPEST